MGTVAAYSVPLREGLFSHRRPRTWIP